MATFLERAVRLVHCVSFVKVCFFPFGFEEGMWDLREADCKHRASDGNSKFCILLKISRFKALNERLRLVKKSVKYAKRFSRYPSFYCCHGNHF